MRTEKILIIFAQKLRSHNHFLQTLRILKQDGVIREEVAFIRIENMKKQNLAVSPPDKIQQRRKRFRLRIEIGKQNRNGVRFQNSRQMRQRHLPAAIA